MSGRREHLGAAVRALDDRRFDLAYPKSVRAVSDMHWTPLKVAVRAAEFLVRGSSTRVLDIGCGPGKFCIAGALATGGHFTGVDRRGRLCEVGRALAARAGVTNVEFVHANVTEMSLAGFDAFYLFNPFAENLGMAPPIDQTVSLSTEHYAEFTAHVARELALAPLGTRVATYFGACEDIPMGYACVGSAVTSELRFWEKVRFHPERTVGEGVE